MLETRLAKEVDGDCWTFRLGVFLLLELCLDSVQVDSCPMQGGIALKTEIVFMFT